MGNIHQRMIRQDEKQRANPKLYKEVARNLEPVKDSNAPPDIELEKDQEESKPAPKGRIFFNGDVLIVEMVRSHPTYPPGTLLPIAHVPQFASPKDAMKFITENGEKLLGKTVLVVRVSEKLEIAMETKARILMNRAVSTGKPKVKWLKPKEES